MRFYFALVFTFFMFVGACDKIIPKPDIKTKSLKGNNHYSKQDYGMLPFGLSADPDSFQNLLEANGSAPMGKVITTSVMFGGVDKAKSCSLEIGEQVILAALVALKDKYYYIVVPVIDCIMPNEEILKEGYIDYEAIELLTKDLMEPDIALEGVVVTQTPVPTSTPSPTPNTDVPVIPEGVCTGVDMKGKGMSNVQPQIQKDVFIPFGFFRKSLTGNNLTFLIQAKNVSKFKFEAFQNTPGSFLGSNKLVSTKEVNLDEFKQVNNYFEITSDKLIPPDWNGEDTTFNISVINSAGKEGSSKCKLIIKLVDPMVLDFTEQQNPELLFLEMWQTDIFFDIDNSGVKKQTGWIKPSKEIAFLTLDKNRNGVIDNGGELFGDNTLLKNGKYPDNGYQALADLDEHKQGFICASNQIYNQLKLWSDLNSDGISQPEELRGLAESGVTKIFTTYKKENLFSEALFANQIYYSSLFQFAHKGRIELKKSYDVFFLTGSSLIK